jgi:salicylate hydroxylase
MSRPHLLIAGAGIAGLTTAIALGRQGARITMVEKRTAFEEAGAGLQLSPNASRILIDLGLSGALTREAVSPERLDIRIWTQPRSFATMPMGDASERFGAPFWVTRRSDLQTALLDAVRQLPDFRLMAGRAIESATIDEGGIGAELTNERGQRETLAADALIGADGLWSQVRAVMGDEGLPGFTGYEAWRALVPAAAALPFMRQPAVALWMGHGRHVVHYPVAASRLINLVFIRQASAPREGWSSGGDARELRDDVSDAAGPLRELIAAAPSWQVWSLFDRVPAAMAHEAFALVGDAAHPVLPFMAQGAACAIEDAAVLARCVTQASDAGQPLSRAFAAYARERRPRVARLHAVARQNAGRYHMAWPLSLARDMVLRHSAPDKLLARYEWLYNWRPAPPVSSEPSA